MNYTSEGGPKIQRHLTDPGGLTHYEVRRNRKPTKYETYEYAPLERRKGAIRLLKLLPSSTQNPDVECELIPLDDPDKNPGYEALSWCWGTDEKKRHIFIRKGHRIYQKYVSPNLFLALKSLRYEDRVRHIWVDAVCIDQEDLNEKNHQVEMMWDIYGNATGVCIWLGEANDASRIALKFINEEVLKLRDFDELCERPDASKKWRSLLELMQRPWFSRRWVVQEIALARSAVIYCGEDQISWKDFAIAVELFVEVETATHRLSEVMRKESKEHHVPGLFEHVSALGASLLVEATDRLFRDYKQEHQPLPEEDNWSDSASSDSDLDEDTSATVRLTRSPGRAGSVRSREEKAGGKKTQMQPLLSLEYLVSSLTIFETTVPHDTIYALLAIAKDTTPRAAQVAGPQSTDHIRDGLEMFTQRKLYNVDYKLPYVDVCKEFIQFAIERSLQVDPSRALDVICRPWATEEKALESRRRAALKDKEKKERVASRQTRKIKKRQALKSASNPTDERRTPDLGDIEERKISSSADSQDMPLPSWIPQLSNAPFGMYQLAGVRGPKMSRKNADPLVGPPISTIKSYAAAETKKIDMKALKFRKRHDLGESRHYSMYVRGFHLDTISKVEQVARNGQIPQEWAELAGWEDIKKLPPEAFWRTLVADRGRDGKNPPVYYSRACCESFKKGGFESGAVNTSDLINYERNSVVSQFCRRVHAVVWNRALIKTEKGRLGLVGKDVKEGDLVCVLYGLSVPVVLKKSERKQEDLYKTELAWELRWIVQTVQQFYCQHIARRKQHVQRKRIEMVKLCEQWLEESRWLQLKGTNRHINKHKKKWTQREYEKLLNDTVKEFKRWRVIKRKNEWRLLGQDIKDEQPDQIMRRASLLTNGDPASDQAKSCKRKFFDWWEYDCQLKFGRRWKRIVKERKERILQEWDAQRKAVLRAAKEEKDRNKQKPPGPDREQTLIDLEGTFVASVPDNEDVSPTRTVTPQLYRTQLSPPEENKQNGNNLAHVFNAERDAMEKLVDIVPKTSLIAGRAILESGIHTEPDSVGGVEGPHSPAPDKADGFLDELNSKEVQTTSKARHLNGSEDYSTTAERKICEARDCGLVREKIVAKDSEEFLRKIVEHPSRCIQDVLENMKKKRGDEGYYSYQLMGECYVHGMMDGEAMLYQNEEDISSAVFEIR